MKSLDKYNKGIKYLLCAIDLFCKYAWVIPIKYKKCVTFTNTFQKIMKESNRKPNKIWVDKGSEFYNNYFKKWLKDNDVEMYSIHNKGKSVAAERFIRTLKNKIFKHMTAISKNVYFDVLDDIINKYNNTVHRTTKMKTIDVKDNTYVDSKKEVNDKDPKIKVRDHVRVSLSEEVFDVDKIKNAVPLTYVTNDLKKLQQHFMQKNCKRLIKKNLE